MDIKPEPELQVEEEFKTEPPIKIEMMEDFQFDNDWGDPWEPNNRMGQQGE